MKRKETRRNFQKSCPSISFEVGSCCWTDHGTKKNIADNIRQRIKVIFRRVLRDRYERNQNDLRNRLDSFFFRDARRLRSWSRNAAVWRVERRDGRWTPPKKCRRPREQKCRLFNHRRQRSTFSTSSNFGAAVAAANVDVDVDRSERRSRGDESDVRRRESFRLFVLDDFRNERRRFQRNHKRGE